jgi:RND family efflux transporter MFP subunit
MPSTRWSHMLKYGSGAAILSGALALSWAAPPSAGSGKEVAAPPLRRVRVDTAVPATAASTLRFPGVVRSERRAALSFSEGGRLVARPVEVGDRIEAGEVVARRETEELIHAADAASAAYTEADTRAGQSLRDLARVRRLVEAKAATPEELEQAEAMAGVRAAAVERAETAVHEARRRLAEACLTAPWSGTVTAVLAEPGEYVAAGAPVVEIAGEGAVEVEVRVPESLLDHLADGDGAVVFLPFADRTVNGRLKSVGRAASGAGSLFPIVVALPSDPALVPGATVEVEVQRRPRSRLTVPLVAVLDPGGARPYLFSVRDSRAEPVAVEVIGLDGDRVAVRGDLAAGTPVVVAGHIGLIAGDRVEVVP